MDTAVGLVYAAVAVSSATVIAGTVISRQKADGPADDRAYDLLEAAFLAGGPGRVADTVISGMYTDGRLAVGGPGVVSVRRPIAHHPVEDTLLRLCARSPHGALNWLRRELMRSAEVQAIGDRLAERGLMVRPDALGFWRGAAKAQIAACWVGAFLSIVTSASDDSVPTGLPLIFKIFPALFLGFVVGAVCAGAAKGRVTGAGKRALKACRRDGGPGRRHAPSAAHHASTAVAAAVALSGAAALTADPLLRDQLLEAQKVPSSAASSGLGSADSSDSSGGSWCGGGGSGCGGSSCGSSSSCGDGGGSGCGGGGGCGGG
ncbi:TIGR04222 domain-containing membrane protein [Streptomyces sp. NPDC005355]|uniref:TIGR04222 domain-containing membrane protein n=1 Tax=Streptomyces sp. NPDC005355 TaxID=3157038 RepID=UPI0033B9B9F7